MTVPDPGSEERIVVMGTSVLREVNVENAVGLVLAHDLTQILPGTFKGRLFRKGHRVTEADIPKLKDIGKEHLYVLELADGDLHEDDAALRMAVALAGEHVVYGEPHEGKVSMRSEIGGLTVIDREMVDAVNGVGEIALATLTNHQVVRAGEALAATRVIPLIVPEAKVQEVERIALRYRDDHGGRAPVSVRPMRRVRAGLLTTGSEVFSGRIADKFGPAVKAKLESLGSELVEQRFAPDDRQTIV
ncbi:MAG: molybdopterin-binding protein, partial [Cohnella sp.]|nr:molybdopterin-binding protein [Cohnella sp.]